MESTACVASQGIRVLEMQDEMPVYQHLFSSKGAGTDLLIGAMTRLSEREGRKWGVTRIRRARRPKAGIGCT